MKTIHRSSAVQSLSSNPEPIAPPRDLLDPLIRRAAHGERPAIELLARRYRRQLVSAARRRVNAIDADDVVQDLFVLLLVGSLTPPGPRESASAWLGNTVAAVAEPYEGR